jgi:hypothetical protein
MRDVRGGLNGTVLAHSRGLGAISGKDSQSLEAKPRWRGPSGGTDTKKFRGSFLVRLFWKIDIGGGWWVYTAGRLVEEGKVNLNSR